MTDPDEVIDHLPAACGGCGADLHDAAPAGVVVRQVRDVPLAEVRITASVASQGVSVREGQHRGRSGRCRRSGRVRSEPGAVAVYLVVYQHVPVERAAQLIADLTGAAPSTGWVSAQVAPPPTRWSRSRS